MYYSAIQACSVLVQLFVVREALKRKLRIDTFRLVWWLARAEWQTMFMLFLGGYALMVALVSREANVLYYFVPW